MGGFSSDREGVVPSDVPLDYRKTLQINEARIVSRFGWGLAKTIENHGLAKFKTNLQRVSSSSITAFTKPPNPFHSHARGFLTS